MTIGEAREQIRLLRERLKNLAEESHVWQQSQTELSSEARLPYVTGLANFCRDLWEGLAVAEEMLRRVEERVGPDYELEVRLSGAEVERLSGLLPPWRSGGRVRPPGASRDTEAGNGAR